MSVSLKQGVLIAITAGGLFTTACKQADEAKSGGAPTAEPARKSVEPKTADPGSAAAATPTPAPGEQTAKVHCTGINACKGQGGCKTAANACAGQNGCKGQGYVDTSEQECKDKGGTVLAGM